MINELTLIKQGNPDEIFSSYYADVLEVAKKKSIAYDSKEKPLFTNTFDFDEDDKIVFCIVTNERKIFAKPLQVAVGSYFTNNDVDYLRVDEILFQIKENYYYDDKASVVISDGTREVNTGDKVPLIRVGLVMKGVINNGTLHLIWDALLNDKIKNWFYRTERDKQIKKQANVELNFKQPKDKDDKEEADIDFLNPDTSPEVKINTMNSKNSFSKWFKKKFPKTANLNTTPLMEAYVKTITKHNKYY